MLTTAQTVDPGSDATRLRALRDALGLPRERVAAVAGVSVGTVRNAEQGRCQTTLANKRAIAAALGLDVAAIWPAAAAPPLDINQTGQQA